MTELRTAEGGARDVTKAPVPVDHLDDDDQFDTTDAPPMTNVANPEDPDHQDVPDIEANKGTALRFIEGVFIKQDPNAVDELAADDFTAHTFGDMQPGREPMKEAMQRAGAGVSDPTFEIHDVIAEKDRVAVRLTTHARHTGKFMGLEPTGNEYTIDEIHIFRVEDGKVLEHWHEFDKARLMQQLQGKGNAAGAPQPPQQAAPAT
jgi:predicted ester cyclase